MGNEISSSGVDIMGQDDATQNLNPDELKILEQNKQSFYKFYTNPFLNDEIIKKHKDIFSKAFGQNFDLYEYYITKFLNNNLHLSGFDLNLDSGQNRPAETSGFDLDLDYELETDRLLDSRNFLSTQDINKLWILYYATNNKIFSDRVKGIARNPLVHTNIREAAISTYNFNISNNYINDPDWFGY